MNRPTFFASTSLLASLAFALALGAVSQSQAAIILTLPTATVAGSFVITEDINFIITTTGAAQAIILDEWVTTDGSWGLMSLTPNQLSYSINGGSPVTAALHSLSDNLNNSSEAVTSNDGYFLTNLPITVALNDVFTVKSATYTLAAGSLPSGFNPQADQTFTGEAFITDQFGFRLSANTPVGAVPEPGSLGLLALGGLAAATRRRRRVVG